MGTALLALLAHAASTVDIEQSKFSRIKKGMSQDEVEAIIGRNVFDSHVGWASDRAIFLVRFDTEGKVDSMTRLSLSSSFLDRIRDWVGL